MPRIASDASIKTVCEVGFNAGHSALRWLLRTKAKAGINFHIISKSHRYAGVFAFDSFFLVDWRHLLAAHPSAGVLI